MTTTTIDAEVREYLDAVREHLADLPDDELDDLTIDLESHLAEVHAEADGSLVDRLGTPERYAAELRASAGFDRARPARPSLADNVAARARHLAAQPSAVKARAAWAAFRPTWVAIRGWLLVTLWVVATAQGGTVFQTFPVPHFGSTVMGLALVALATVASFAAAGRAGDDRRWRRIDAGFTAVAAALLLVAVAAGPELRDADAFVVQDFAEEDILANYPLVGVGNIFAYDLNGNPLEAVLLYDQDGNPLDLHPWTEGSHEEVRFRADRFGEPIKNAYPVQQYRYTPTVDETGAEVGATYEPVPPPRVPLPEVDGRPAEEPPASEPPPVDTPERSRLAPR